MIQAFKYNLLPQNCLHIKNHIIWKPLAYLSNSQKLDSLNKIELDVSFNHLIYGLEIFKSYDFDVSAVLK